MAFSLSPKKLRLTAENTAAAIPLLIAHAHETARTLNLGTYAQRKAGSGENFWQYREYQTSDKPQDIDWRKSAKSDQVYVRQQEWQSAQNNVFWCADYAGMDFSSDKKTPSKAWSGSVIALTLALILKTLHERIGYLGAGKSGTSENILQTIAAVLCEKVKGQDLPDAAALSGISQKTRLFLIGDFLNPLSEIEPLIRTGGGKTKNGFLIQVLDPAELDLPYEGRAAFHQPGAQLQETVDHVASVRRAYQERINAHLAELRSIAEKNGWHYHLYRTDTPLSHSLEALFEIITQKERRP